MTTNTLSKNTKALSATIIYPATEYDKDITKILFSPQVIQDRTKQLAQQISLHYKNKDLVVVGLLRGAFIFLSDLCRQISVPHSIDFMILSSYVGTHTSHNVKISHDMSIDVYGKHVLIVEDIIDTGTTLVWLNEYLSTRNAASIKICCLLDKVANRECNVNIDYVGFECPNVFVVGYGMDYNQLYRSLPYIGILSSKVYSTGSGDSKDQENRDNNNVGTDGSI